MMNSKPYLLDVNVLIALAWPLHVYHSVCHEWFSRKSKRGFRTCPTTQGGFVRLSSSPAFLRYALKPVDALLALGRILEMPEHEFWPDDLSLTEAIAHPERLRGHRQITDAYLLGLARKHQGIVATLDEGLASLDPSRELVEVVRPAV